jgi:hypothetical protein
MLRPRIPIKKERFEAALGKPLEDPGTAVFGRATNASLLRIGYVARAT